MKVNEILKQKLTFSFEFFPPKSEEQFLSFNETLKELSLLKPDFVSITDTNFGNSKYKHIALSKILIEKFNFDIILHLTCLNNTKQDINNLLEQSKKNGIKNILALRGDKDPNAKIIPKDFLYASDLLKVINKEEFSIGVSAHPEKHPESLNINEDVKVLKIKKELGASFAITQLFFDNNSFLRYRDLLIKNSIDLPIIAGIMPLTNPDNLIKIEEKAGKIQKPKELISILEKYKNEKEDFLKASIDFSTKQIEELIKENISGIHFFTFNKAKAAKSIFKNLKK